MRGITTMTWSTESYAQADRFSAWEQQLNSTYLRFVLDTTVAGTSKGENYCAVIKQRSIDGLKVVDCQCDPFKGARGRSEMGADNDEIIGIQLVVSGREKLNIGGDEVTLSTGDILVWDNTRPIAFSVEERLHKISVIMPLSRFKSWLPTSWYMIDKKIEASSKSNRLLSLFMKYLPDHVIANGTNSGEALSEATMGLLINAIGQAGHQESETLRGTQLFRVRQFIHNNLDQPTLSPSKIAAANKISIRYLHWLFESEGITVSQYIIQQRLIRCHRELANPHMKKRTITDIAFSWGFNNSTHFSRRFKQEFGLSPQEFRGMGKYVSTATVQ